MAVTAEKNAGFILLHRSLRDHWLWKDPIKFQWWVDILMECNHDNNKVPIGYSVVECSRGQSIKSCLTWGKRWRKNKNTVHRFLKMLEKDEMITIENVQKTTRITVCNYEFYNNIKNHVGMKVGQSRDDGGKIEGTNGVQTKNEERTKKEVSGAKAPSYKQWSEKQFYDEVAKFAKDYPKNLLRQFYDHWREPSPSGMMAFQLKKTWSTSLRLKNWQRIEKSRPGEKSVIQQSSPTLKTPELHD